MSENDYRFPRVRAGQQVEALDFNRLADALESYIAHLAQHLLVDPTGVHATQGVVLWGLEVTQSDVGEQKRVAVAPGAMLLPGNAGANNLAGRTDHNGSNGGVVDDKLRGDAWRLVVLEETAYLNYDAPTPPRTHMVQIKPLYTGFGSGSPDWLESRRVREVDNDGNVSFQLPNLSTYRKCEAAASMVMATEDVDGVNESGAGRLAAVGLAIVDLRNTLYPTHKSTPATRGLAEQLAAFSADITANNNVRTSEPWKDFRTIAWGTVEVSTDGDDDSATVTVDSIDGVADPTVVFQESESVPPGVHQIVVSGLGFANATDYMVQATAYAVDSTGGGYLQPMAVGQYARTGDGFTLNAHYFYNSAAGAHQQGLDELVPANDSMTFDYVVQFEVRRWTGS